MLRFEKTDIDLGVIPPNETHFVNYVILEGSTGDIGTINKSCSCTGQPVYLGNTIQFEYKDSVSQKYTVETMKTFPDFQIPVEFTLTVYLKSPQPHTALNPNTGKMEYIASVSNINLTFKGKIDCSSLVK